MKGGTLFSGIGAPEQSAPWIDWRWSADIDEFANAVRAHHWPTVPNLGDVSEIDHESIEPIDVLVFGSPCQSFSVAGKRLGLDDPRGNLALVALGLAATVRPSWVVFENVPGLLSSDDGRDFQAFVRTATECGYCLAWRVLDAQFAGVPQRRRRVFAVGHLGDWRPSAAVLFEPHSLQGHPPPRREAGEGSAGSAGTGAGVCGFNNTGQGWWNDARGVAGTIRTPDGGGSRESTVIASTGHTAHCLNAGGMGRQDYETETLVAWDFHQITAPINRQNRQPGDPCHTLARDNADKATITGGSMVRRLTPTECERLQGFPDGFTDIPWKGKRAPDSRRYKALGNSMAVPVIGWILDRIGAFETEAAA